MRATIMQKLIETGERERLKDLLRERLIQCGWRDELKVVPGGFPRPRVYIFLASCSKRLLCSSRSSDPSTNQSAAQGSKYVATPQEIHTGRRSCTCTCSFTRTAHDEGTTHCASGNSAQEKTASRSSPIALRGLLVPPRPTLRSTARRLSAGKGWRRFRSTSSSTR